MHTTKINGNLKNYLRWPLYLGVLLIALNIHLYTYDVHIGLITTAYVAGYFLIAVFLYIFKRKALINDLVNYAMRFNVSMKNLAADMEIPLCILDTGGRCIFANTLFKETFVTDTGKGYSITDVIPAITMKSMPASDGETGDMHFHVDDMYYHAIIKRIDIAGETSAMKVDGGDAATGETLFVIYIYDETEIVHVIRENYDQRLDVGLLYIDNYEDSLETVDDVRRGLLAALVDRKVNKYMMQYDAITRKLEKDKYIFLFKHKYLAQMQANKFSLLEDIKTVNSSGDSDVSITISMGVGIQADTFRTRQEYARSAIDLALGRGGDQVVIKSKDNILYYGGKSIEQEKNTRVKARVKAHALRDSIEAAERVIIMGHNLPDVDAIGAAIGIYRIATALGKDARIVVGQVTSALEPLLKLFEGNKDYPDNLFLSGGEASEYVGNGVGVLLVVVDVNRPSHTDAPGLIGKVSSVVVIDHHRQAGESFENPTLSYVEPFASSACEMVAEIVQYSGEEVKLKTLEADALYSGIMVDTNNFMNKPGVRTFEAVAFLRRSGAEIIRIRKMFRTDINEYKVQAEAIQNMELFMDSYAIAPCNAGGCPDPTIVGAKIANSFLDIKGIKASFVLTYFDGKIFISARSIDELNVQLVMERLGGGGHINSAGAQLSGCTLSEGAAKVREVLTTMKKEGDID